MENIEKTTKINCLGCGNTDLQGLFEHWGMLFIDSTFHEVKSSYQLCSDCGLISSLPTPSDELLLGHYSSMASEDALLCKERSKEAFAWILERIQPKRVLEVGCGNGELLQDLREATGCEIMGVDPSNTRRARAEGINVPIVDSIEKISEKYDLVILSHVLEHVSDPASMLAALAERVTENGVIYVEVPALNQSKHASEQTIHLTHLHHWTGNTLSEFCRLQGLSTIDAREDVVSGYPCARILIRPSSSSTSNVDPESAREDFVREVAKIEGRYANVVQSIEESDEVVLFGAGSDTLHLLRTHPNLADRVSMIIDSDPNKQGAKICGITISELGKRPPNVPVVLMAMMPSTQASMRKSLATKVVNEIELKVYSPHALSA